MAGSQLDTFIKVAESGSFSKAAELLYMTPTAVMKQINALEDGLNITLFERTNHGLTLTKAGGSFLQDARYMAEYYSRAVEKAREIEEGENRKSIRIGVSAMTPARFVLDIWSQIQERIPNLKIELIPYENNPVNAREILKNLGQHIDIVGGLYDDNFLKDRGCAATHLYDKKLLLAVPVSNPLCNQSLITAKKLRGSTVLFIRRGWNVHVDKLRAELEGEGVQTEEFDMFNLGAYNRAVAQNMPIITVEGWEDVHPLLKFVPTDWDCRIPFGVLHSPAPSKLVKRFLDIVGKITAN